MITQNESFCWHQSNSYLFRNLPETSKISGMKIFSPSLSGLKLTLFQKAVSTLKIIGLKFTIYNAINLFASKMSGASGYNFPRGKSNSILSMLKNCFLED